MRTRKRFPGDGVYSVIGGLSDDNYISESDKKIYRYIRPAYPDTPPDSYLADCWIVDRKGRTMPDCILPIPIRKDRIGRVILLPDYVSVPKMTRLIYG